MNKKNPTDRPDRKKTGENKKESTTGRRGASRPSSRESIQAERRGPKKEDDATKPVRRGRFSSTEKEVEKPKRAAETYGERPVKVILEKPWETKKSPAADVSGTGSEERGFRARKPAGFKSDRPARESSSEKPWMKNRASGESSGEEKSFGARKSAGFKSDRPARESSSEKPWMKNRASGESSGEEKSFGARKSAGFKSDRPARESSPEKPWMKNRASGESSGEEKSFGAGEKKSYRSRKPTNESVEKPADAKGWTAPTRPAKRTVTPSVLQKVTKRKEAIDVAYSEAPMLGKETIRLNKFIASCGFCSRRDADEAILGGRVKVDGKMVLEPGTQVKPDSVVVIDGTVLTPEPMVYVLLHKPKNTITTVDDEEGRSTVLDLVREATPMRVFPVGRLDRNTSGLLLMTNDGELAHRLLHPKYKVEKVYKFDLAEQLSPENQKLLTTGVKLEDGMARAYFVQEMDATRKSFKIGVHEGRNHLIRRMLDAVEAKILRLKRTDFGPLKLETLEVGNWRYLSEDEVNLLRKITGLKPIAFKA